MTDTTTATKQRNPWVVYGTLLFGLFVMMLILSMNPPAYPAISADLGINSAYIAWMSAAYSMGAAVLSPVMGRMGDLFGMKKILLFGMGIFAVGTLLMGIAPSFAVILCGRIVQGLGVASVMPACMAFAGRFFPPDKVAKAYTVFGAVCSGGCIFGPAIAGWLCTSFSWRVMYNASAATTAVAFLLPLFMMPNVPIIKRERAKFDVMGSVTLFIAVGSLLILPTLASQIGWTAPLSLLLIALFVVFLILFIVVERRAASPLVNLDMFKRRSFVVPVLMFMIMGGFTTAFMYYMSYYFTAGRGLAATMSGTWTMVFFLVMTVCATVVSRLLAKVNWKIVAFIPVVAYGAGSLLFGLCSNSTPVYVLFIGAVLLGFGGAFNTPLPTASAMDGVSDESRGGASGTFRMIGDLGAPLFVSIFVPLLSILEANPDGTPNFAASFPKVSMLMLIPAAILLLLAFVYPSHDPKQDQKPAA
ncbi:MFS transporter [Ruminococcaceae bacterium OttesenSCG-928-O06]|nr:MFS transporter [Ruminococcaceae bacterium OttesenSCG-928-O06]